MEISVKKKQKNSIHWWIVSTLTMAALLAAAMTYLEQIGTIRQ